MVSESDVRQSRLEGPGSPVTTRTRKAGGAAAHQHHEAAATPSRITPTDTRSPLTQLPDAVSSAQSGYGPYPQTEGFWLSVSGFWKYRSLSIRNASGVRGTGGSTMGCEGLGRTSLIACATTSNPRELAVGRARAALSATARAPTPIPNPTDFGAGPRTPAMHTTPRADARAGAAATGTFATRTMEHERAAISADMLTRARRRTTMFGFDGRCTHKKRTASSQSVEHGCATSATAYFLESRIGCFLLTFGGSRPSTSYGCNN